MTTNNRPLRNKSVVETGRKELGIYDSCFEFNSAAGMMDVDGTVERKGYFLYVEMKKPGEKLTVGQERYYENRINDNLSTVIIRWGTIGETQWVRIVGVHDAPVACNEERFRELLKAWSKASDNKRLFDARKFWYGTHSKLKMPSIRLPKPKKPVQ